MDKNYLIQLTNNLYRLTLLFPKKEPLRYKMRELADDILAKPNEKDLEVLDSFFEVAKSQNWVSPNDILEIQKEYSKLKEDLEKSESRIGDVEVRPQQIPPQQVPIEIGSRLVQNDGDRISINQRQEKILEILKEKGKAQVGELKQIFPEVSKRTLRRDFEFLLKQGKIERIGERNDTFYRLKVGQETM